MEETIERTERVVETLRQVALAATEDPNVSQQNLPEKLASLVNQYVDLSDTAQQAPNVTVPMRLIQLVDEGREPASYVDQQLQGAYMQELGNAVSTETLQALRNELSHALEHDPELATPASAGMDTKKEEEDTATS